MGGLEVRTPTIVAPATELAEYQAANPERQGKKPDDRARLRIVAGG